MRKKNKRTAKRKAVACSAWLAALDVKLMELEAEEMALTALIKIHDANDYLVLRRATVLQIMDRLRVVRKTSS